MRFTLRQILAASDRVAEIADRDSVLLVGAGLAEQFPVELARFG